MEEYQTIVASAQRTLDTELGGLTILREAFAAELSSGFVQAVTRISTINGRVIVTGMGKSGHIGAKIAATFASTGTPAQFVHPAEANHGDLGMITREDVVLAISKSGESSELKSIVGYSRRFAIPLIAMTCAPASTLGKAADICLTLPQVDEACPHNLAPTTSTLMQLALGDALAVALLETRGFSASDFRTFHPGGSLGASLVHVGEVMRTGSEFPAIKANASVLEAAAEITSKGFGCVVVLNDAGGLAGIITDGDLRRNIGRNLAALKAADIMNAKPVTAGPDDLAGKAMARMNLATKPITTLVVVDGERSTPVGLLRMHDLLRIGVA
jgi:arabinose-5-phosphate isomerase